MKRQQYEYHILCNNSKQNPGLFFIMVK